MTETRLDVLAIGDAVVDVLAYIDDSFLDDVHVVKGSMQVLDADGATELYARMPQADEVSGGSAANTMAGVCFSPDAGTMFVNVYNPGRTLAITGPWRNFRGA